jgi:hypothetical protein
MQFVLSCCIPPNTHGGLQPTTDTGLYACPATRLASQLDSAVGVLLLSCSAAVGGSPAVPCIWWSPLCTNQDIKRCPYSNCMCVAAWARMPSWPDTWQVSPDQAVQIFD